MSLTNEEMDELDKKIFRYLHCARDLLRKKLAQRDRKNETLTCVEIEQVAAKLAAEHGDFEISAGLYEIALRNHPEEQKNLARLLEGGKRIH